MAIYHITYFDSMSKSLRVSDTLFDAATLSGSILSRSTAQQVEYWARLGKALEDRGLTVDSATALLAATSQVDEKTLWANKRQLQRRDVALARAGKVKQSDLHLFSAEAARSAKILNGPY